MTSQTAGFLIGSFMKRSRHSHKGHGNASSYDAEVARGGFSCSHCKQWVVINPFIGTANRNHCHWCFWSKHVDIKKGDRRAVCQAGMRPIALTFKHEGFGREGELMIVHQCAQCQKISINRIARDDPEYLVMELFVASQQLSAPVRALLAAQDIVCLDSDDESAVRRQLFGV